MSSEASCELQRDWLLDSKLADRLDKVFQDWFTETRIGISMLSGYRTEKEQLDLAQKGRPAVDPKISTHTACPATGADVRINGFVTRTMKAIFGRIVVLNGLRWGGGSAVDDIGIPLDWNHVDLGPRSQTS